MPYIIKSLPDQEKVMHEFSLAQEAIKIIERFSASTPFERILRVSVEVGELIALEKSALLLAFGVLAKGTKAQGSQFHILEIPGRGICESCQQSFTIKQKFQYCPRCEDSLLKITQGDELKIKNIEVR